MRSSGLGLVHGDKWLIQIQTIKRDLLFYPVYLLTVHNNLWLLWMDYSDTASEILEEPECVLFNVILTVNSELMQMATWYAFCRLWPIGNAITSMECFNTLANYNSTFINTYELIICICTDTNTNSLLVSRHSWIYNIEITLFFLCSIPSAWNSTHHYCYHIVYTPSWYQLTDHSLDCRSPCVKLSIPLCCILSLLMEYLI